MDACKNWICKICGNVGLEGDPDGYYYCTLCSSQEDDIIVTSTADEDIMANGIYKASHRRKVTHDMGVTGIQQHRPLYDSQPMLFKALGLQDLVPQWTQDDGPPVCFDFESMSFEDNCNAVRTRYVLGLQILLQLQCETLVNDCKVTPRICDYVEKIWLDFVTHTNVFGQDWADEVITDSEKRHSDKEEIVHKLYEKHKLEPRNVYGKRAVMILYNSLRETIPLDCTLAISFLACHLAREAVLPTDITKWVIERKLPYISAFLEIEKNMGSPEKACPITSSQMFNPSRHDSPQEIESLAAKIADSIGLELPPVNFFEIASRYLRQLHLPYDKILPKAMLVYEWSMPPDSWLSTSGSKSPNRLCVLSILIVSIRMLYNINGFGFWESSLFNNPTMLKYKGKGAMDLYFNEEDATKLLCHLHSLYTGLPQEHEHTKGLRTYLKYCEDFVFAGLEPSFENYVEKTMMENLQDYYQNFSLDEKDPCEPSNSSLKQKKERDKGYSSSRIHKRAAKKKQKRMNKHESTNVQRIDSDDFHVNSLDLEQKVKTIDGALGNEETLMLLKLDMKEKGFRYIRPRKNPKKFDYLHYVRKKDDGVLVYAAHADYYILLRACAYVAQVDIRIMHLAVLNFEKRLIWLEDKIEETLHFISEKIMCDGCERRENKTKRKDAFISLEYLKEKLKDSSLPDAVSIATILDACNLLRCDHKGITSVEDLGKNTGIDPPIFSLKWPQDEVSPTQTVGSKLKRKGKGFCVEKKKLKLKAN